MSSVLQCHTCRRYWWNALDSDRCSAFPDGIPDVIWLGGVSHDEPVAGDGGVVRERTAVRGEDVRLRHDLWGKRAVDRIEHGKDPLGAIVMAVDAVPSSPPAGPEALLAAWRVTADAPAMLLVLLRAGLTSEVARAVHLTSEQLALEGCDYNDNKGWLGVGLTLATFATESALANARAAWSALTSPFRDGYVTARTQQTLLRALRRAVPRPPPVERWTGLLGEASVGILDDGVVALGLAPSKNRLGIDDVELLEPWQRVNSAETLETELARELEPGHRLHGRHGLRALARRADRDDVLFANETLAAVVHLTWAKESDPAWPSADLYPSLEAWITQRMEPDHAAHGPRKHRIFAVAFRSELSLAAILAKLPEAQYWGWTQLESQWYGAYVSGRDDVTRVRIFAEEEPERFAMQVEFLPDDGASAATWFSTMRAMATEVILPAIEAVDVTEASPDKD